MRDDRFLFCKNFHKSEKYIFLLAADNKLVIKNSNPCRRLAPWTDCKKGKQSLAKQTVFRSRHGSLAYVIQRKLTLLQGQIQAETAVE